MLSAEQLAQKVMAAAVQELDEAISTIKHCLDQLSEEQVWHRPGEGQNAIANLLLHLAGNLRQLLVVGLGGGRDDRNRPPEFADNSGRPKAELMEKLEGTIADVKRVLMEQTPDDLVRLRRIQGRDFSGMAAVFAAVPHFRGHTQEIVFRTRLLLGTKYRFARVLPTKEQGA